MDGNPESGSSQKPDKGKGVDRGHTSGGSQAEKSDKAKGIDKGQTPYRPDSPRTADFEEIHILSLSQLAQLESEIDYVRNNNTHKEELMRIHRELSKATTANKAAMDQYAHTRNSLDKANADLKVVGYQSHLDRREINGANLSSSESPTHDPDFERAIKESLSKKSASPVAGPSTETRTLASLESSQLKRALEESLKPEYKGGSLDTSYPEGESSKGKRKSEYKDERGESSKRPRNT